MNPVIYLFLAILGGGFVLFLLVALWAACAAGGYDDERMGRDE